MPESDLNPTANSGLPSIQDLMGLKMRMESSNRAEQYAQDQREFRAQGREFTRESMDFQQSSAQVDKIRSKFTGLKNMGQRKHFLEAVKSDPQAMQAFQRAGLNPDLILDPMDIGEETRIAEGIGNVNEAIAIRRGTRENEAMLNQQLGIDQTNLELAKQISPAGQALRMISQRDRVSTSKEISDYDYKLRKAHSATQESGGVRDPGTGKVRFSTRAKAEADGLPFITKAPFDNEFKAQEGFDPAYTLMLNVWSNPKGSIAQAWDEELRKTKTGMNLLNTGQTPIDFTSRMLGNYLNAGSGRVKTRVISFLVRCFVWS